MSNNKNSLTAPILESVRVEAISVVKHNSTAFPGMRYIVNYTGISRDKNPCGGTMGYIFFIDGKYIFCGLKNTPEAVFESLQALRDAFGEKYKVSVKLFE